MADLSEKEKKSLIDMIGSDKSIKIMKAVGRGLIAIGAVKVAIVTGDLTVLHQALRDMV